MVTAVAATNDTDALVLDLERALYRVNWLAQQQFAHQLEHYEMTVAQYHTLCLLLDGPDTGIKMSDVARATGHTLATMTGIVDRLVRRGLVERKGKPGDRRVVLIALHPDGEMLAIRARDTRRNGLALALAKMPQVSRLDLLNTLDRFAEALGVRSV